MAPRLRARSCNSAYGDTSPLEAGLRSPTIECVVSPIPRHRISCGCYNTPAQLSRRNPARTSGIKESFPTQPREQVRWRMDCAITGSWQGGVSMRILLYNPDNGVTANFMPHLWMFLLQALTPAGHEVLLIDGNTQPMSDAEIVS